MCPTCKLTVLQMRVEDRSLPGQKQSSCFSGPSEQHEQGICIGSSWSPKSHGDDWRGPGGCCTHHGFASHLEQGTPSLGSTNPIKGMRACLTLVLPGDITAQYKYLLSALYPRGRHCVFQGCLLNKYPRRQTPKQRSSVPLLTRGAEMQETRGELSRNTHKPQAESPTSPLGRAQGGAGGDAS